MIITWTHDKVCPKSSNKPSSIKFCFMHFMHKLSCKARFPFNYDFQQHSNQLNVMNCTVCNKVYFKIAKDKNKFK